MLTLLLTFTLLITMLRLILNKKIAGEKDVEIMVLLKYLSNIWRVLEIPSINCVKLIPF